MILWFLAYSTLHIDVDYFSDRFMGAVTSLLVLAALLSSINDQLPKTAYLKRIDVWLLWHIANNFLIIIWHVILDKIYDKNYDSTSLVQPIADSNGENAKFITRFRHRWTKTRLNEFAIITLPIVDALFYLFYFPWAL